MAATATTMTLALVAGHAWCLFLKILPIFDLCCQCGQPLLRVVIPETKRREFKISLQFDLSQKVVGWSQRARIQIQRSPVRIPLKEKLNVRQVIVKDRLYCNIILIKIEFSQLLIFLSLPHEENSRQLSGPNAGLEPNDLSSNLFASKWGK